jgi:hypothetical protein
MSGNFNSQSQIITSLNTAKTSTPRFKQILVKRQDIQRKFYRKVSLGEDIYSKEIFKQGLNVIIVQRDRGYTKCKIIIIKII